jgi:hypothetical protein
MAKVKGKKPAQPFEEKLIHFTQEEINDIEERRGVFEQIKREGKLTKEIQIMEVLARIGDEGKSLRRACAGVMTRSEFYKELDRNEELDDQYTRACEDRIDLLVDSTLEIAADNSGDLSHIKASKDAEGKLVLEVKENREFAARSKTKIDAIQWYVSKVDRKRFGNKVELDGELKEDVIIHLNLGAGNDVDDPDK